MDLNADGKMDLISGSFDGGFYFVEGLGDGKFAVQQPIMDRAGARILLSNYWSYEEKKWTELETSKVPGEHAISVTTVDWDNDGDLDLLIGGRSGKLFLRRNEGTAGEAAFATSNEPISGISVPGGTAMVCVADWNLDGAWDIVSGADDGAVYWFANTGSKGKPRFGDAQKLVNAPADRGDSKGDAIQPGTRVQVSVGDCNADGRPDLLMGDYQSLTVKGTEFTPETRAKYDALLQELRAVGERIKALAEKEGEEKSPERTKLETKRSDLAKEMGKVRPQTSRHGWVWLFERKARAASD